MEKRQELIDELGFTITFDFVPFSKSRNKAEKSPSLNWVAHLMVNGTEVITTDYMQGCGHTQAYKKTGYQQRNTVRCHEMMLKECETGFAHMRLKVEKPTIEDVLFSLSMDSGAVDHDFESWAADYGYDEDSRKALYIYNQCLEIGLKLQRAIGADGLERLRDSFQDY